MSELLIENHGAVRVLTMSRPDKRNALNMALSEALLEGLRAAEADDAVRSVVLTGAGRAFCAGADLSEFKDLTPDNAQLVERRSELTMNLHRIFSQLSKPVVTAVNGAAMGGGAGLALAGDVTLMASTATLGYPEVKHGIVAAVVMANLVRNVGRKAAFEMLVTGDLIDAAAAVQRGLINRSVPAERLDQEIDRLAAAIAAKPRSVIAGGKALFYRQIELGIAPAYQLAGQAMACNMTDDIAQEGASAFIEKRSPDWSADRSA